MNAIEIVTGIATYYAAPYIGGPLFCGGTYAETAVDDAHVDGNLVTAPAWPAHPRWLAAFLDVLGTTITHN